MLSCDKIWPIKCYAPLTSRQESKCALTGWLHYCFWALIAMFEHQNWNQSVIWQIHALSFLILTKTFDLVNLSRYFDRTRGPPILEMISDLGHLYHKCPWSDVIRMGCYLCYENDHGKFCVKFLDFIKDTNQLI